MPELIADPLLDRAVEMEGFKVLPPCVLYSKIGKGAMGVVYRAWHLNLDIDVAVKCLRPSLAEGDDQFVHRFLREGRAAARINHQNVIRVYDVVENHGLHYIIMELVRGETARERLVRKRRLKVEEAVEMVYGAALGLREAHEKDIVHRDIKPDNILIAANGEVKVADLGLAKPLVHGDGASLLSMATNVVMGTPQYMPPEQWDDSSTVTAAADVWALGATLFFLLAGEEAIPHDSVPRIMRRIITERFPDVRTKREDVPEDVAEVVAKATADLDDRFADAGELTDALEKLSLDRMRLRDQESGTSPIHQSLVSPPPAKTLAKIRTSLATPTPGGLQGDVAATLATIRSKQTEATEIARPPRRVGRWLLAAVALLVLGTGAYYSPEIIKALQPVDKVFRIADAMEEEGRWRDAVTELERIRKDQPELPGVTERLAGCHAAIGDEHFRNQEFGKALECYQRSFDEVDAETARSSIRMCLGAITDQLNAALVRTQPRGVVFEGKPAKFVGELKHALAKTMRIDGHAIPLGAGGVFSKEIPITDKAKTSLPVEVTLVGNWVVPRVVSLDAWEVAIEVIPPDKTPLGVLDSIVLDDDMPYSLSVRSEPGATVTVDGERVVYGPQEDEREFIVQSSEDEPAPIKITAVADSKTPSDKTVALTRKSLALTFVEVPTLVGGAGGQVATMTSVQVRGKLSERADRLLLRDESVPVSWDQNDEGAFTCSALLLPDRDNVLTFVAERRFRSNATQSVTIRCVNTVPTLAIAEIGESTPGEEIDLAVDATVYVTKVVARNKANEEERELEKQAGGGNKFTGQLRLEYGDNEIELVATNAKGSTTEKQTIRRIAPPKFSDYTLLVDGVEKSKDDGPVFVRTRACQIRFKQSGDVAEYTLKVSQPGLANAPLPVQPEVLTSGHFVLPIGDYLEEDEPVTLAVRAFNLAGDGPPLVFRVQLDTTPPTVTVESPTKDQVVLAGPVEFKGTCSEDCKTVFVGERAITPANGSWAGQVTVRVSHGIPVHAVDLAGNKSDAQVITLSVTMPKPKPKPANTPAGFEEVPKSPRNAGECPREIRHTRTGHVLKAFPWNPRGTSRPTYFSSACVTLKEFGGAGGSPAYKSYSDALAWAKRHRFVLMSEKLWKRIMDAGQAGPMRASVWVDDGSANASMPFYKKDGKRGGVWKISEAVPPDPPYPGIGFRVTLER